VVRSRCPGRVAHALCDSRTFMLCTGNAVCMRPLVWLTRLVSFVLYAAARAVDCRAQEAVRGKEGELFCMQHGN
jgi:hypothetical protein